jgi:hypothetical protein
MLLTFLIVGCLILSVSINTFIKGVVYSNVADHEETEDGPSTGLFLTAFGVVVISNMIPFTLGAIIGLYAIL